MEDSPESNSEQGKQAGLLFPLLLLWPPQPGSAREPITMQRQCRLLGPPLDDNPHQVLNHCTRRKKVCCICTPTSRQVPSKQMAALSLPSPAIQIHVKSLPGPRRPWGTAHRAGSTLSLIPCCMKALRAHTFGPHLAGGRSLFQQVGWVYTAGRAPGKLWAWKGWTQLGFYQG